MSLHHRLRQMLARADSPIQLARGNKRNCTPARRAHAAGMSDRMEVASDVASFLLLESVPPLPLPVVVDDSDDSDSDNDEVQPPPPIFPSERLRVSAAFLSRAGEQVSRPLWAGDDPPLDPAQPPARIANFGQQECWEKFRFTRDDLQTLVTELDIPEHFRGRIDDSMFDGEEAFLMTLYRMSSLTTFRSMRVPWNMEADQICQAVNTVMEWIDVNHGHLIDDSQPPPVHWGQRPTGLVRWASQVAVWAAAIAILVGVMIPWQFGLVCCFVDGM